MFISPTRTILNQSANMTVYLTPESKGETLTARQAGTERLMGKYSIARHLHRAHTHTARWLPQVSVFTHEEHLNFKLLQKHVSALTRLSVTPQRLDNRTSTINVKLAGCANLPPISCLQHETFLPNAYFFSIIYEACHFPLPKASPYQRGCPNLPNFEAHPDSVF